MISKIELSCRYEFGLFLNLCTSESPENLCNADVHCAAVPREEEEYLSVCLYVFLFLYESIIHLCSYHP